MNFATRRLAVWFISTALTVCLGAQAAQGKRRDKKGDGNLPVTFAIEHATELKLSDDQLKRLAVWQDFEEKVRTDPGVRDLIAKRKQARRDGDEKDLAEENAHIAAVIKERSGGRVSSFVEAVAQVLTPEQMTLFHTLRDPAKSASGTPGTPGAPGVPPMKNPFDL